MLVLTDSSALELTLSEASDHPGERRHARAGEAVLAHALGRARLAIFWERLWPALASIATAIGLFLALSWLGLWVSLPPLGRAIGLLTRGTPGWSRGVRLQPGRTRRLRHLRGR